ncbi:putative transcription factor B3-Domain family [Helianthus annuus]|uniref:Transcription factor B3-Domain family n=1 Tax=Helianthus annuus TaxID=4232 RepID=A0A9K3DWE2_HELAN|nr:uncharacterized protein LOC118487996 isoform X1 [Helianthus annuus]XP_035840849.1 uncharacterized protein LOC118487996 isoform X1 [Helianthus annuus]KAF5761792.1 putative transcription factor B3-Domain family [Helianthus annuus]KAJ0439577.1 putative transcription factor B3-Domain family [Helianthus annuus]KAJ0461962.1 putative transcription factor B3-Domain family [Helianthus annuus]KAJ0646233.1 putative transcription factor B3-Domain family [Helianthus annuus]KAJ0822890.1 putative transcr
MLFNTDFLHLMVQESSFVASGKQNQDDAKRRPTLKRKHSPNHNDYLVLRKTGKTSAEMTPEVPDECLGVSTFVISGILGRSKIIKILTAYDTSYAGSILLPKKSVKNELLPLIDSSLHSGVHDGSAQVEVVLANVTDGRSFTLHLTCRRRSYILKNVYKVLKTYGINTGDLVEFYPRKFLDKKLYIGFKFSHVSPRVP